MKERSGDEKQKSEVALREEAILAFWEEHEIFKQSVEKEAPQGDFIFYDGPPFATGLPHYGHILAGTIKDAIPRFWTMNGYRVRRTWGWDCHGLPLENLIEKKLGLATKRDIEAYGVKNFNEAARGAVLEFADDWKRIMPRMGRWADMEHDYKTMDATYTESVWWVFSELHKKGLVYEGQKSMHLCPRCGTTLSNFEVNLGYKDIKDIAVTVKLPLLDDVGNPTDVSLLVWTTTPWTLPGNMAAAVHGDVTYVEAQVETETGTERVIIAKERLAQLGDSTYDIRREFSGKELVGRRYEPPFSYWKLEDLEHKENAWKIYHADYVEIGTEGTGAVHLAPAYGEEDMNLAREHHIPIVHHVDLDGHFKPFVTDFAGQLVKPKDDDTSGITHLDADIQVLKKLQERGRIFKKENITHSYPHCWRCDTPLLNYATSSWFVRVTDIKDDVVAENNKVRWVPSHVGANRFGKWLEGARDWAVSRQRYWGAPLPIWRNPVTKDYEVFGSLADVQAHVRQSGNTYYTMRHGESEKNVAEIVTNVVDAYPLTERGRSETETTARTLKETIDLIITSPVLRARETAELMAQQLGLSAEQILVDERIRETEHGVYEGKTLAEFFSAYPRGIERFSSAPEGGETWSDIKKRMGEFLYDLEKSYQGKRILIVSHGDPLALLHAVAKGIGKETIVTTWDEGYPDKGDVRELSFVPMPHNDHYELDFHRPYIDDIELFSDEGVRLERVADVFDCWFESGSMPYGQHHYPFEGNDTFLKEYFPAQFIAEGLDQTRGWFYSLIVLGTALFGKSPYENVIVNGLVLAEDGKKMSKKLQNYPDPMDLADRVGVDAIRYYLLSSPVIRGEDLNFSEREVLEQQRKNIGRLHNVLAMYELYADQTPAGNSSPHVLDRWIVARLNSLVNEATAGYRAYELDRATRPLADFIDDLSVWYLRRSRDRLKGDDKEDRTRALATLRYTLRSLALTMAPVMPFYAEYLWGRVREGDDPASVHLAPWPEGCVVDPVVVGEMSIVRELVTLALEVRTRANIKVRQPLSVLRMNIELEESYTAIVADEINVKSVVYDPTLTERITLDTTITPELKEEGDTREIIRAIQEMRKTCGFSPHDRVNISIDHTDAELAFVQKYGEEIMKAVGGVLTDQSMPGAGVSEQTKEVTVGPMIFTVRIWKS